MMESVILTSDDAIMGAFYLCVQGFLRRGWCAKDNNKKQSGARGNLRAFTVIATITKIQCVDNRRQIPEAARHPGTNLLPQPQHPNKERQHASHQHECGNQESDRCLHPVDAVTSGRSIAIRVHDSAGTILRGRHKRRDQRRKAAGQNPTWGNGLR
ncbi:MAG: hypothetical protein ACLGXA_09330 [Acidobacteriota bacterium]